MEVDGNAAVWKSDDHVAAWLTTSDERRREREEPLALLADLLPFEDEQAFVVVDLGAGTGAAARAVLDRYPAASALLAEYSPQMAEAGTRALEAYRGRFRYVEVDLLQGDWASALPERVDAVVSSMALHHLPDARKQELCADVLELLAPGGWFFDLDVVTAGHRIVEAAWQRAAGRHDPSAAHRAAHRSPEEQQRFENHTRHISPLDRRLRFLEATGFEAVDVYWRRLESVLLGGARPAQVTAGRR